MRKASFLKFNSMNFGKYFAKNTTSDVLGAMHSSFAQRHMRQCLACHRQFASFYVH